MANNLDQQKQMNELLERQNKLWESQTKVLKVQTALMAQLVASMQGLNPKDATDQFRELNDVIKELSENGTEAGDNATRGMRSAAEAAEEALNKFERLNPTMGGFIKNLANINIAASAWKGASAGFGFSINVFRDLLSLTSSLVGSLFQVGVAILSIPFQMFNALVNSATGGSNEWRQALEEVRKAFGDLTKNSAADLLQMEKNLTGTIAQTGLSTYRIFGNRAEQLNTLREYATKLGAAFNVLSKSIASSAVETERFAAYMKGLGMSDAGIKGVGERAVALGTTVNEIGREITTFAFQVGNAFGINGRQISADIGEMIGDISHFGNLTVKEMAQAAVFTRKLGLEFKAILGVVDAFDNFDKAAEGAAQLSQAFGMNIDAIQMVREQDPAARFEAMRKSFFATGRAVEQMTRQEINLLAAQTGLSAEAVKLGFASKNQAMSYDQVQKSADGAAKKQLTQEEAMKKLANSIDRLVKSGSQLQGGFIERFLQGFMKGIERSREFREMFRSIMRALRDTYYAGMQVGRMFVELFPGVKDFFKAIAGIFDRGRFRDMLMSVKFTFFQFFRDIARNPQEGVQKFISSLKENFFNWFNGRSTQGMQVLDSLKNFFKAFIGIITQLSRMAIQGLIDGAKMLLDYIKDPTSLGIDDAASGFMSTVIEIFGPLWDMLKEMLPQLGTVLWELFTLSLEWAWSKLQPYWEEYKGTIILGMVAWFAGPAIIGALAGAIAGTLIKAIGIGLANVATGGAISRQAGGLMNAIFGINRAAAGAPAAPDTPPVPSKGFFERIGEGLKTLAEMSIDFKNASSNAIKIGAIITAGLIPLIGAIILIAGIIQTSGISATSIILAGLIIAKSAAIVVAVGYMAKALGAVGNIEAVNKNLASVGLFIVALTTFMGIALAGLIYAIQNIPITTDDIGKLDDIVDIMAVLFGTLGGLALAVGLLSGAANKALAGIVPVGLFIGAMGFIMYQLADSFIGITKDISAEQLTSITGLLNAVSDFMVKSVPLAGAAILLGAAILGGGPLAFLTGGLLAAGLAALGATVAAALEAAELIINRASEFNLSAASVANIQTILSIISAVTQFMNGFILIVSLAREPGDIEGKGGIVNNSLAQINTFIVDFLTNSRQFIDQIIQFAGGINSSQLPSIKAVTDVIQSVTEFATGITSVFAGLGAKASIGLTGVTLEGGGTQINNVLDAVDYILADAGIYIPAFIHLALVAADRMNREHTTPEQLSGIANVVGGFMGAIANFVKALASPQISSLSGNEGGRLTNLRQFIVNLSTGLLGGEGGGVMGTAIGAILQNLTAFARGVTPEDVKKIQPIVGFITPLFSTLAEISKAVASLGGGALRSANGGEGVDASAITSLGTMFTSIFTALREFLPNLITSLNTTLRGVDANGLGAKAKALAPVFSLISTVQQVISQFYWTARNAGGGMANWNSEGGGGIAGGLRTLRTLFRTNNSGGSFFEILKDIIDGIQEQLTPELLNKVGGINIRNINKLKTVMEAVKAISEAVGSMKGTFLNETGRLAAGFSGTGIHNMIAPIASVIIALTDDKFAPANTGKVSGYTLTELLDGYENLKTNKLSNVRDVLNNLSSIASEINSFKNATESIKTITGMDIHNAVAPIASTFIALSQDTFAAQAQGASGQTLSEILSGYSTLSTEPIANASEVLRSFRTLATNVLDFKNSFDPAIFEDNTWMTGFFGGISAFANEVARVNNDLVNLAAMPVEIAANLETIANSLGQDLNYQIETGTINFTINLRVNLKADDLANVLIDKEYVVPGAKGAGFVNGGG